MQRKKRNVLGSKIYREHTEVKESGRKRKERSKHTLIKLCNVQYRNVEHFPRPEPKMYSLCKGGDITESIRWSQLVHSGNIPLVCQGSLSTDLFPHFIQAVVACDCLAEIIKRKHFNHRALSLEKSTTVVVKF